MVVSHLLAACFREPHGLSSTRTLVEIVHTQVGQAHSVLQDRSPARPWFARVPSVEQGDEGERGEAGSQLREARKSSPHYRAIYNLIGAQLRPVFTFQILPLPRPIDQLFFND